MKTNTDIKDKGTKTTKKGKMLIYEIYKTLNTDERIKILIRNPRYAIIYQGKEVKKYPFLRQAIQYKIKHDSVLFDEIVDIVDKWTGEIIIG